MTNTRFSGNHVDAVDRAGFNAKITAGAFISDHCVHDFRRTQDRIDRAGLNALSAADAFRFSDVGDQRLFLGTVLGICLLYTSPSPRDATLSRMPSSA